MSTLDSRPRAIVRAASVRAEDPAIATWLNYDERGNWERRAAELPDRTADKAAAMALSASEVDELIASRLVLEALEATISAARKEARP